MPQLINLSYRPTPPHDDIARLLAALSYARPTRRRRAVEFD
jgi:hypothetical protein